MSFSHRMCAPRHSVVVVLVFMASFLGSPEAMPQCNENDAESINIIPEWERNLDGCKCVKFHECADPPPKDPENPEEGDFLGLIDERNKPVIDLSIIRHGNCKGLEICCKSIKTKEPKKTTVKCPKTPSGPVKQGPTKPSDPVIPQWKCGKRQEDGVGVRVTGFKDGQTQQGEFPWMVAVMGQDNTFVGGGSLVHPRAVLTAGHKVYKKTPASLKARVGDWDISQEIESATPQNIDVENILYHPSFNRPTHEYNVAILILKTEAVYGETVAPVCLPEPGQNFDGKNCFVTGWGKDDFEGGQFQTIMKKVEVPIVDHSRCQTMLRKTRLGSTYVLHSSFTCAGGLAEDACTGDGGSPLVCPGPNPDELIQVGVVSWGIGCGVVGNPGVYGSVVESMDWIAPTIQNELGTSIDIRLG